MKRPSVEDVIIWGCVLFTALVMLWLMLGCTPSAKAVGYDILWVDGKCVLHVSVSTIEEAAQIQKGWKFKDCEVQADIDDAKN